MNQTAPSTVKDIIAVLSKYDPNTPILISDPDNQTLASGIKIETVDAYPTLNGNEYAVFDPSTCTQYLPAGAISALTMLGVCYP